MRKFLIGLIVVLAVAFAYTAYSAPVLVIAKTANVAWDPVTTLADGSALPSGGAMSYDVLYQLTGGGTVTLAQNVTTTSAAVTFPTAWTAYDLGVRAVLTYQGNVVNSTIVWGSTGGTPSPFTFLSGQSPSGIKNLRVQ